VQSPHVAPTLVDVRYRVIPRHELGDGGLGVLFLFLVAVRLRRLLATRRGVALWLSGTSEGEPPDLVFPVADDALIDGPPSGAGKAFGDLVPNGVLGLVVGDDTVEWPTYPPRVGTAADARRSRR
jgi:hypothetical protein